MATYLEEILKIRTMMGLNEDATSTTSSSTSTGSVWDSGVKRGPGNPLEEGDKLESFAETRLGGAETIASNAKEKGGAALLTYHHFEVKLKYYEKASKGELDMEDAKKEYKDLLEKLYTSTKDDMGIEQIDFQELLGKMEVLGELIIKENEKGA